MSSTEKEIDYKTGYGCFTMFVSAAAIIIALISLLKWDDKICNVSGESITIAALSALITFVVAWQIWQTMASREEIRKAEIATRKVSALQDELQLLKDVPEGYLFYTLAIMKYGDKKYFDAFEFYHTAIRSFIRNRVDYAKYTTVALDAMVDCIEYATRNNDEFDKFRNCSGMVLKIITALELDIENVNRLVDEARRKVQAIRAKAQEHGVI